MTNKMIPADKVRKLAARFRDQLVPHIPAAEYEVWERATEAVEALLPAPTLADMTEAERRECRWMQCEVRGDRRIITRIRDDDDHNYAVTLAPSGYTAHCLFESVTPRPDLPRLEWPDADRGGEEVTKVDYVSVAGGRTAYGPWTVARLRKKPDPALPEGWRLADHQKYGRVVVTNTTPARSGEHVSFVAPAPGTIGNDWHICTSDALTYLDTDNQAQEEE